MPHLTLLYVPIHIPNTISLIPEAASFAVILIAAVALTGWIVDIEQLQSGGNSA